MTRSSLHLACLVAVFLGTAHAFSPLISNERRGTEMRMTKAGSFFNEVPDNDDNNEDQERDSNANTPKPNDASLPFDFDSSVQDIIRQRASPSAGVPPSTIGGIPTSQATGFGKDIKSVKKMNKKPKKPFIALGEPDKPLNDINNLEYDDQGHTLYANEETGEKSRVFEALVEYPSVFTIKIIGADDGSFVPEIVQVVAESCEVAFEEIVHSTRLKGKWTSITVKAPVHSAEMLYKLYENVDRDPRVKFKF
mmetsp:Transcript_4819/g.7131  ORF Transcript_4819/g.7131 Transcript_4819/m.7131 type:complete len:251 (+) Transcript_4819:66-818(+)